MSWSIKAQIIVFGGVNNNFDKVSPDIAVLNTKTEPFEWTGPSVSSNIGKFPSLQQIGLKITWS